MSNLSLVQPRVKTRLFPLSGLMVELFARLSVAMTTHHYALRAPSSGPAASCRERPPEVRTRTPAPGLCVIITTLYSTSAMLFADAEDELCAPVRFIVNEYKYDYQT